MNQEKRALLLTVLIIGVTAQLFFAGLLLVGYLSRRRGCPTFGIYCRS